MILSRIERARLSLEGLAIGDALGEMLSYKCDLARERVEKGLVGGPWFRTDDTEMALSIFEICAAVDTSTRTNSPCRFAERSGGPELRLRPHGGQGPQRLTHRPPESRGRRRPRRLRWHGFDGQRQRHARRARRRLLRRRPRYLPARRGCTSAAVTPPIPKGKPAPSPSPSRLPWPGVCAIVPRRKPPPNCSVKSTNAHPMARRGSESPAPGIFPFFTTPRIAARNLGNGSAVTAPDTIPYTVWSAAKHLDDYKGGVDLHGHRRWRSRAPHCLIVGGIVALSCGLDGIPADWRETLEKFDFEDNKWISKATKGDVTKLAVDVIVNAANSS